MAARKGRRATGKRVVDAEGKIKVHGRAARGSGSVFYVESEGVWRASYTLAGEYERTRTGEFRLTRAGSKIPKRRYVRATTQAGAIKKRDDAVAEHERFHRLKSFNKDTTVRELCDYWLSNVAPGKVRPSTLATLRTRLTPGRLGDLDAVAVVDLTMEMVTMWQAELGRGDAPLAAGTIADTKVTFGQVIEEAVNIGLVPTNVVRKVTPPKVRRRKGRSLTPTEARSLVEHCQGRRYGLAVAFLFVQGWRVSEVLGLAWQDVDLDAGTARVRRAVTEVKGAGRQLTKPKTEGAEGTHHLAPGIVAKLREHRAAQLEERFAAGPLWTTHEYEEERIDLVFTRQDGGLVARQHIDKLMRTAAEELGIDTSRLGTHVGRRTVVTNLYLNGATIEEIRDHVGHKATTTTEGYVTDLGERPAKVAKLAAELLDGTSTSNG